jgi:hypothetical protein
MKPTRRQLAAAVLVPSAASLAQTQRAVPAADDELKAARDRLRSNAEALAGEKLPMAVEPAFQFRA